VCVCVCACACVCVRVCVCVVCGVWCVHVSLCMRLHTSASVGTIHLACYVAVCCSALQCVAAHCSVLQLQCVATIFGSYDYLNRDLE